MIYEFPDTSMRIRQGDIFVGLPRVDMSLNNVLIVSEAGERVAKWAEIAAKGDPVNIIVPVRPVAAIVATQDCDAVRSRDITLLEIRSFKDVERKSKDTTSAKSWKNLITQHARINQKWFYLPPDDRVGFSEKMAVDFMVTLRVPRAELEELRDLRKGRLFMTMHGPQYLEERRKGIGGSDIAAVLGLSPWKTAYQVYQEKRKEVDDWKGNEATDWGKRLEPVLRQWYSDTTGRAVRVPEKILCHGRYPYMLASLDGFTDDGRIVEIKTARHGKGWGQPGTSEIPDYYALQCQHYMVVTGYEVTDVPVSIGGGSPKLYEVPADRDVQEMILDAAADFWRRVEAGDPPEPVSYADVVSRYGASRGAGAVYAKPEDLELIVKLRKVRETMTGLEEIEDEIKAKLILSIGEGKDTLTDDEGLALVTYKLGRPVSRFDTKAFEKEHPELYKSYLKTSEAQRRFLLK